MIEHNKNGTFVKNARVRALFVISCLLIIPLVNGQTDTSRLKSDTASGRIYILQKVDRDGVVLPEVEIKEIYVMASSRPGESRRSQSLFKRYERTVYNVKRVYPYALIVRSKLDEVNEALKELENDRDRRKYINDFEKDVFRQYEGDMTRLTLTQARILIKLIDMETLNTSYELIKQYRGGISAAFWQGVARFFGTNLKDEYDPYGADLLIELIVQEIESGGL